MSAQIPKMISAKIYKGEKRNEIKLVRKKIGNVNPEVIASFHPAFLMRQPDQKKYAWEDLKMIRKKNV